VNINITSILWTSYREDYDPVILTHRWNQIADLDLLSLAYDAGNGTWTRYAGNGEGG